MEVYDELIKALKEIGKAVEYIKKYLYIDEERKQ